ncbi:L,D-transpeptidase [Mesorhizobium sp. IMUNJ 23232]|uniref:L,D-transpeptidase n=1 Tax=Mesorhizobium sp. IMUNJ 23232 TaxID=3376064 RepID=UPI003788C10E
MSRDHNSQDALKLTRRTFLVAAGSTTLAACSPSLEGLDMSSTGSIRPKISVDAGVTSPATMYASVTEGSFVLPAIPYEKIPREFRRQIVQDPTGEAPGTIVVDLKNHFLYLVQSGGDALRYGVGIGKAGFEWSGRANIQYKKQWPTWKPPAEMIGRKPELVKWANGQPGGIDNPLGARALYIFKDGVDTGYRIHGSPEWWTIGQNMSSGCVRMINQDVIDLYNRVPGKTTVVVY